MAGFGERRKSEQEPGKTVEISGHGGTMVSSEQNGAVTVQEVGELDIEKYRCVSDAIRSREVVLTDNQREHIIKRRGAELTGDDPKRQNSIITAILENNKRFAQRLRNNQPLYKKE